MSATPPDPPPRVVLIVDDEPHIRRIIGIKLKQMGLEPMDAPDGAEALDLIRRHGPPALAIVDIMMPKLDGLSLLKKLREDPATRELPVVFVTAVRETEDRDKALALGAKTVILKPFKSGDLEAAVRSALAT